MERRLQLSVEPLEARMAPAVFIVNSAVDAPDEGIDGYALDAYGNTTLRAAIQEANATPEVDEIRFAIQDSLVVLSIYIGGLPQIEHPLIIDGASSDPNYQNQRIYIDGSAAGDGATGLYFATGSDGSFGAERRYRQL